VSEKSSRLLVKVLIWHPKFFANGTKQPRSQQLIEPRKAERRVVMRNSSILLLKPIIAHKHFRYLRSAGELRHLSKATLFTLQISMFCANYWLAHEHDGGMRWLCRRSYSAVLLGCSATGRLEANMQRCWYTLNELRQLSFHLATGKHAETLVYTQRASTAWFPPRLMILSTYSFLNSWESSIKSMGTRE